ncbi:MAG: hypothetical protein K9H64_16465 [Bacteroidales bacterium]|nr:hypothetical protein [Bacteroidales bacterium]
MNDLFIKNYKPIIKKLLEEKLIDVNLIKKHKDFLTRLHLYFPWEHHSNKIIEPDNYFTVWMDYNVGLNNPKRLELMNKFDSMSYKQPNIFFISINQFELFLKDIYEDPYEIFWFDIYKNKRIKWTTEILIKYSGILDWKSLYENEGIEWNEKLLDANINVFDWYSVSLHAKIYWDERLLNKYIYELSWSEISKKKLNFTKKLIWKFIDYWDWPSLCSNKNVNWDIQLIEKFERYVSFSSLSKNYSIKWTEELIKKYVVKWNWEALSGNPSLPWSANFISKYKSRLNWIPLDDLSEARFLRHDWYYQYKNQCVSGNTGILWDHYSIRFFENNIDFWIASLNCKFTKEAIVKCGDKFNRFEKVGYDHLHFSDWTNTVSVFKSGWENLAENPNFVINKELIEFLYLYKVFVTKNYMDGPIASKKSIEYSVLELAKEREIEGISLEDILHNYERWGKILFNEDFINNTLWLVDIKPIILKYGIEHYIDKVKVGN